MWHNFSRLFRYRGLIQTLVVRDLKARYRGSVLGYFWSFVNPLLLLGIYSFVFATIMKSDDVKTQPYAVFMFCGILPWTWFSSSLLESSASLIAGGNLIKKVLFPAEVLPIVSVFSNMVHFAFGLPILAGFMLYYGHTPLLSNFVWFPVVVLVQLILTIAFALLVSALTVHFRDLRDLLANVLTLWFFATPIIYPISVAPARIQPFLNLNPFTHLAVAYQEVLFHAGPFYQWDRLLLVAAEGLVAFLVGYFVFDRLRDALPEEV